MPQKCPFDESTPYPLILPEESGKGVLKPVCLELGIQDFVDPFPVLMVFSAGHFLSETRKAMLSLYAITQ